LTAGSTEQISVPLDWRQLDIRQDGDWWTEAGRVPLTVSQFVGDPNSHLIDVDDT